MARRLVLELQALVSVQRVVSGVGFMVPTSPWRLGKACLVSLYLRCLGGYFYLEVALSLFSNGVGSRDVWCEWCYGGAMAETSSMASSSRCLDTPLDLSPSSWLLDLS